MHRRDEERIRAKRLNLKHLVRIRHDLPQHDRLVQFLLPVRTRLYRLGVYGPQTTEAPVVMNRARIDETRVGLAIDLLLTCVGVGAAPAAQAAKETLTSLLRRVGKVY